MTPEQYKQAKSLFAKGLDIPAAEREHWLADACSDTELREAVIDLWKEHDEPIDFVEGQLERGIGDMFDAEDRPADLTGQPTPLPDRIGRYQILRVVGQGAMGTVYEAQQQSPKRRVALKVIRSNIISPRIWRRFQLEAQVLGYLQHPGIAQIYEASIDEQSSEQTPFFAMEFIHGQSLTTFAKARALNVDQRLELVSRMCDAAQHAHQKGVIHRDLKPANILVADEDVNESGHDSGTRRTGTGPIAGQPKIVDFGIARLINSDQQIVTLETNVGELLGTLCYMSPEQMSGNSADIDTQSDVYALGVILYELLAGHPPFDFRGVAITEAARIVREEGPPKLGTVDANFRGDIETIVDKAMAKQRDRRYSTAAELAADIRRYLEDEPIQARPATAFYQLRKFANRNKGLVGGLAATVLALLIGVIGTGYGFVQASRQRANLERVVKFQSAMLTELDVEQMGRLAVSRVRTELGDSLEVCEWLEPAQRTSIKEWLDSAIPGINGTSLASELVDQSILARATATVEDEFGGQPRVAASLRFSIGKAYHAIGLFDPALEQLREARDIIEETDGSVNDLALNIRRELCTTLINKGEYGEAEEVCRSALDDHLRRLGPDDARTVHGTFRMAGLLRNQSRFDEAAALFQKAVDTARRALGPDHPETIEALGSQGAFLQAQGKFAEAKALLEEALASCRSAYGNSHTKTIEALNNLGIWHTNKRKYEEAEAYFREAADLARTVYGDDHPEALVNIHNLGYILCYQSEVDEAESILTETLAKRRRVLGNDHPSTIATMNTLAATLLRSDRAEKAIPIQQQALDASTRGLGKDSRAVTKAIQNLATSYARLGDFESSARYARRAFERLQAAHGSDHRDAIFARVYLGRILLADGLAQEALPLVERGLALAEETGEEYDMRIVNYVAANAQVRLALGQGDVAEPECRKLLTVVRRLDPPNPAITARSQQLLAESLALQGKLAAAEETLQECKDVLSAADKSDSWEMDFADCTLGLVRILQARFDEAERLLLGGIDNLEMKEHTIHPTGSPGVIRTVRRHLVRLYETWGKPDLAKDWR